MIETNRIDRALVNRDLRRLAAVLGPVLSRGLLSIQVGPVPLGPILHSRLPGSPTDLIYDAMASALLELGDDELVALLDLAGLELGAWRGYHPPATAADLEFPHQVLERLLERVP